MQEELISLETAKLAKELGFNKWVSHFYLEDDSKPFHTFHMFEDFSDIMEDSELENHNDISFQNKPHYQNRYSAPTQSLLQRWLREKHNIHIEINSINRTIPYKDGYYVVLRGIGFEINLDKDKQGNWYPILENLEDLGYKIFNSYEEALEEGLKQALSLIKKNNYEKSVTNCTFI